MTSPGDATAQLIAKDKRIAELEAQVNCGQEPCSWVGGACLHHYKRYYDNAVAKVKDTTTRAEKAEAEVERLRALIPGEQHPVCQECGHRGTLRNGQFIHSFCRCDVDGIEGGGRESESLLSQKPRENENLVPHGAVSTSAHDSGTPDEATASPATPSGVSPSLPQSVHEGHKQWMSPLWRDDVRYCDECWRILAELAANRKERSP